VPVGNEETSTNRSFKLIGTWRGRGNVNKNIMAPIIAAQDRIRKEQLKRQTRIIFQLMIQIVMQEDVIPVHLPKNQVIEK
jgi:hypothetical protein